MSIGDLYRFDAGIYSLAAEREASVGHIGHAPHKRNPRNYTLHPKPYWFRAHVSPPWEA